MKKIEQIKIHHTQELALDQNGNHILESQQSIELSKQTIDAGFFKNLPGPMLSVYLYLVTHIGLDYSLSTNPQKIADCLPLSTIEIEIALKMLETRNFLTITEFNDIEKQYTISFASPDQEALLATPTKIIDLKFNQSDFQPKTSIIDYILKQKAFSEEDLVRAISAMIPAQKLNSSFRQEIEYWFKTFDKEVIKELIRRTDEAWQRNHELNCQAYMRKIASDWISEQVFTLTELKESDKLYRETRSLIEEFGIERQNEMTRTHWRTISSWINVSSDDDFALSSEVAKFAVQTAIMQKSDGRPSLTYIENNFIKPLKEHKIKNTKEAQEFLIKRKSSSLNNKKIPQNKSDDQQTKWQLGIDFSRFREN